MSTTLQHGEIYQVGVSCTGVYQGPSELSAIETEALFGESVQVTGFVGEWASVVTLLDKYPGHVRKTDLIRQLIPGHRVNVPLAPLYREPTFKTPLLKHQLYFNSLVQIEERQETPEGFMIKAKNADWLFEDELVPISHMASDYVAETMKLLGLRYTWGMRSSRFDCSSAIQAGCIAAGIPCPRDCGPQSKVLGDLVDYAHDFSNLKRGDLVFWTENKGRHVTMMVDSESCFHATIAKPYHKALIQPLKDVIQDQARDGNGRVTAVRRFPDYNPSP